MGIPVMGIPVMGIPAGGCMGSAANPGVGSVVGGSDGSVTPPGWPTDKAVSNNIEFMVVPDSMG
jgi:hypothetical protein